jgi:acyl-CoA synthetase (AMP-forming)/AMP-acid ligase II
VTPANAVYSALELKHQLLSAGAQALFTCIPLLETAIQAASGAGIPKDKVFIMPMPDLLETGNTSLPFITLDELVLEGRLLPKLEPLRWNRGQGARQTAFLCYSSGTSGLPVRSSSIHQSVFCLTDFCVLLLESGHDFSPQRDRQRTAARYI